MVPRKSFNWMVICRSITASKIWVLYASFYCTYLTSTFILIIIIILQKLGNILQIATPHFKNNNDSSASQTIGPKATYYAITTDDSSYAEFESDS